MKISLKLYASLGQYLPPGAERNVAEIEIPEEANLVSVLTDHGVPLELCHLVLVNGIYVAPTDRHNQPLKDGDALAVWPPVAGG